MNCREIRDRLSFYLDGELPLSQSHPIQQHLESCEGCARAAESEGNFRETLGRMEYHPTPPGLATRISAALDGGPRRAWFAPAWLLSRPALGAAVAVLLVALVVAVGRPGLVRSGLSPTALSALAAGNGRLQGQLVCIGCSAMGASIDQQRRCRKFGHVTGLEAADGTVWHFVERPRTRGLLYDPHRRGMRVDVEGTLYQEIRYIDVARVSDI